MSKHWYKCLTQCCVVLQIVALVNRIVPCSGDLLKIRPKLCTNALGEEGTCMFVWECIKTEGKHLGTCVDGFLFGSCCGHNETINNLDQMTSSLATTVDSFVVTVNNKHKNKWKPTISTISTTSIATSITTKSPVHLSSTESSLKPSTSNSAYFKPFTTTRPWSIYTANKPLYGSTFRPAVISSIPSHNKPIIHIPQTTKVSIRSTTPRPTNINKVPSQSQINVVQIESSNNKNPVSHQPLLNSTSISQPPLNANNGNVSHTITSTATTSPEPTRDSGKKPVHSRNQCGITQVKPKTKVVGGKNSAFGAWPWQVSVRRTSFFGFSSTHRCGGAILNNQWIATAGHCVDDLLLTQIRIRMGEYDFSSALEPLPHIERGAKKKVVHPKYNFFTYENDLALVQLDEPIEFQPHVSAICLPPDNINLLGRNATVTGWGRLSEGGVLPTVLQEVRVPIMSNDKCKNMFLSAGRHEYIPDIFMCAGYDEGGRDSCQGDSGGPLQVQGDDGKWFLGGIISWGIGCGEPSLPGVCTRITKFKQWISSYIYN